MDMVIARIGDNATVKYAATELRRLIRKMDKLKLVQIRQYEGKITTDEDIIWVGIDGSCAENNLDDAIYIDVKNGSGIITGANPRSVLIAVYRFAYELGCRFLRPGEGGEKIPEKTLSNEEINVHVDEKASYRHRSVCIEGGTAYEHVYNMINWLPKVGMNGYFMQFQIPVAFFRNFYQIENPYFPRKSIDTDEIAHLWADLEDEIILRGLNYHAVGHGWANEALGMHIMGWQRYREPLSPEIKECLAEVNGVRELNDGFPTLTELCYSKDHVRNIVTDTIVDYCKKHPKVNYLHFWLSDGKNCHCECDDCRDTLPSDYYVMMLNELDEKLTAAGLDTKIVCLIYKALFWVAQKNKIKNPDRFVLMFAPITRSYSTSYADIDVTAPVELEEYVRNKEIVPSSVAQNVAYLKTWQKDQLSKDSFLFDYHLMWDHYNDPGYYEVARGVHRDMAALEKIGINGMVSCQLQRETLPTGLPMYSMAKALWDKNSKFEDVAEEYFTAAFGEDGKTVETYLSTLSKLFGIKFMRCESTMTNEEMAASVREAKRVVTEFNAEHIKLKSGISIDWKLLDYHADICIMYADMLLAGLAGDNDAMQREWEVLADYISRTEPELHEYLDMRSFRFGWPMVNKWTKERIKRVN